MMNLRSDIPILPEGIGDKKGRRNDNPIFPFPHDALEKFPT